MSNGIVEDEAIMAGGQNGAIVESQRRHLSQRIDREEVAAVRQSLAARICLRVARGGAGFIQRDAGGERAGHRCKVQFHDRCLRVR